MPELKRVLSTFDLTMIAIGGTIGSGIFLTPSLIAQQLPSPEWIIGIWVAGGVLTLCGALTFAELGGMLPQAGGMYVYLAEAYGKLAGFLFGWAYLLVVNTGGIAALSIAFATYLGYFFPLGPVGIQVVAILGLSTVTLLNIVGVKAGGVFSDVFTLLKLAGIAGLIAVGFGWGSESLLGNGDPQTTGFSGTIAAAMVGVLWSYGGWQHASFTAGEAKNPSRSVPLAMTIGALTVTIVYVLTNIAYLLLLSPGEISASPRVAADAVGKVLGPVAGSAIALAIFISTFGSTGIYTLTVPRVYFAMASDGIFFKKVSEIHPRFQTPVFAILLQSSWALILILFWGTFSELISYVVFTDWIFFGLTALAVIVLRRTRPEATRPYKTFGYPITPLVFVGTSVWFVINTLIDKPVQAWAGLAFLSIGVPVYFWWKRKGIRT
jgi:APA family basic amino acid/polyamine antiporter